MELLCAFLIDLWIGDPVYTFHPVRLMGQGIEAGEVWLRRWVNNTYLAGAILAVVFPLIVFGLVYVLIDVCYQIHFILGWLVNAAGIYTAISVHDLNKEAVQIYEDLNSGSLDQARQDLSRIVGRDTQALDEPDIVRATVETVAESTVDGIVSPLFYAALGGAPFALTYKAINTLDSMVGHRNERYCQFGYASAKLDDAVNWIPARLAYLIIVLAAFLTKKRTRSAWRAGWHEVKKICGISDIPQAAFAGALGVRLGGANHYAGQTVCKPYLGQALQPLQPATILQSLNLMLASAWVTLGGIFVIFSL